MTKIILIGPPGAGKGTQAEMMTKELQIPCISTGQILRTEITEKSNLGLASQEFIDKGELVPDELILKIVHRRIKQPDCEKGYILDGFPRTIHQAQEVAALHLDVNAVIYINVLDEVILERLSGRWIHLPSGRVYHEKFNPPKEHCKDNETGEALSQRQDDKRESIIKRLKSFREDTAPVIDYYKRKSDFSDTKFVEINGDQALDTVFSEIKSFIKSI